MQHVFKMIDSKIEEFKKFWMDIVNIESPTDDKDAVNRVCDYIADFASKKGLGIKKYPFERAGSGLVISLNKNSKNEPIAFMGHMDTVHEKGKFGYPVIKMDDKYLYGPGVHDCKGGIAIALLVMTALKEINYKDREIRLVLSPDEEVSNFYSRQDGINFIRDNVRGCAAAFNCESGSLNGEIVVARKGVLRLEIEVKGKAAHSGSAFNSGISAIKEAAYKIIEINGIKDGITFNCGTISGGTQPNIVPEKCSFSVDIRYNTFNDREIAIKYIEEIVKKSFVDGTVSEYKVISDRVPMDETKENLDLFYQLKAISEKYDLENLKCIESGGGSDSCYSVNEGVPSLCAIGIAGSDQHTLNERAEIASLARRAKMLTAVTLDFQ